MANDNLSCRGGDTAIVITPDSKTMIKKHCGEKVYTHCVITKHIRFVDWGWFKWCTSLQEAEDCVANKIPKSEGSSRQIRIIPTPEFLCL